MSKFLMQEIQEDYELLESPCEAEPNTQYRMGMEIHEDLRTGETFYKGLNGSKGVELEKVYMHEDLEKILLPEKVYNQLVNSMENKEEHEINRVAVRYNGNFTNLNIEVVNDETSEGIVVMPDLAELLKVKKSYTEGNTSKIEDTLSIYPVR